MAWSELNELEAEAELITFSYGDYRPGSMRSHNFDAEAIAIRGEEIWLFSKTEVMETQSFTAFRKNSRCL